MKLANEIKGLLGEEAKARIENKQGEAGDSSTELGHWHKNNIDTSGNGRTIQTLPTGFTDHEHKIVKWELQPAGEDNHTHTVIA